MKPEYVDKILEFEWFLLSLSEEDRVTVLEALHIVVCPHCGAYPGRRCNCTKDT